MTTLLRLSYQDEVQSRRSRFETGWGSRRKMCKLQAWPWNCYWGLPSTKGNGFGKGRTSTAENSVHRHNACWRKSPLTSGRRLLHKATSSRPTQILNTILEHSETETDDGYLEFLVRQETNALIEDRTYIREITSQRCCRHSTTENGPLKGCEWCLPSSTGTWSEKLVTGNFKNETLQRPDHHEPPTRRRPLPRSSWESEHDTPTAQKLDHLKAFLLPDKTIRFSTLNYNGKSLPQSCTSMDSGQQHTNLALSKRIRKEVGVGVEPVTFLYSKWTWSTISIKSSSQNGPRSLFFPGRGGLVKGKGTSDHNQQEEPKGRKSET